MWPPCKWTTRSTATRATNGDYYRKGRLLGICAEVDTRTALSLEPKADVIHYFYNNIFMFHHVLLPTCIDYSGNLFCRAGLVLRGDFLNSTNLTCIALCEGKNYHIIPIATAKENEEFGI